MKYLLYLICIGMLFNSGCATYKYSGMPDSVSSDNIECCNGAGSKYCYRALACESVANQCLAAGNDTLAIEFFIKATSFENRRWITFLDILPRLKQQDSTKIRNNALEFVQKYRSITDDGIEKRPEILFALAEVYREVEPKNSKKASGLYKEACTTGYSEACSKLKKYKMDYDAEAARASAEQLSEKNQYVAEQNKERDERAHEQYMADRADRQEMTNMFLDGMQQITNEVVAGSQRLQDTRQQIAEEQRRQREENARIRREEQEQARQERERISREQEQRRRAQEAERARQEQKRLAELEQQRQEAEERTKDVGYMNGTCLDKSGGRCCNGYKTASECQSDTGSGCIKVSRKQLTERIRNENAILSGGAGVACDPWWWSDTIR